MEGGDGPESEMWKIGGDIQSAMFAEDVKPLMVSGSAWNLDANSAAGAAVSSREMLFSTSSSTSTDMMHHHPSHGGGLIYGHSGSWNGMELAENSGLGMSRSSGGLSHLMDIGEGFVSSYISFTQCLQSGLQMDASAYHNISRSLGIAGRDSNQFDDYNTNSHHDVSHSSFDFPSPLAEAGDHMGDALNVPTTPNSSLSSSSAEGNEEVTVASTKETPAATPRPDQAPPATADQDESQDKLSADSKKVNKPRKKGQKRNREPRFAFMTKSDVDHLEDGYRWRKYGQKAVKNSPYPRSYYRCTNAKCSVKKRVERSYEDPSIVITTYEGQHTHQSPASLRSSGGSGGGGGGGGPALTSDHILHAHLADQRGSLSMNMNMDMSSSGFTQSPFDFPLPMMVQAPLLTNTSLFEHHIQHQGGGVGGGGVGRGGGIPSPHPALQRSQPQNLTDHGLLQDIFPSGMRKHS